MEAGRETSLPTARMDVPSSSSSSSHFDDLVSAERESSSSGGEQRYKQTHVSSLEAPQLLQSNAAKIVLGPIYALVFLYSGVVCVSKY